MARPEANGGSMEAIAIPPRTDGDSIAVDYSENRDQLRATLDGRLEWISSDDYLALARKSSGALIGVRISAFSYLVEAAQTFSNASNANSVSLEAIIDAAVTASSLKRHREGLSHEIYRDYSEARDFSRKFRVEIDSEAIEACADALRRRRIRLNRPFR